MLTTPRRITLYWLLLLVPALAVGGAAIYLLRREHARVVERSAQADEARRAAVAARTRLIAENIELLIGDVQTGLLDTLAAEPAEGLDAFLERWQAENPLVRNAFRATADGRIVWPNARSGTEEARGFLRRFSQQFNDRLPWKQSVASEMAKVGTDREQAGGETRRKIEANVAQAASARRDVQELLKTPDYSNTLPPDVRQSAVPESGLRYSARGDAYPRGRGPSDAAYDADSSRASAPTRAANTKTAAALPQKVRAKDGPPDRRGWSPWTTDARLHLLGWVQPTGSDEVRGVELELAELVSRFAGALPTETNFGEGYVLRDAEHRIIHQAGAPPRNGLPSVHTPLSSALLPGWEVVGYLTNVSAENGPDRAFFWASALLVAAFIAAIVAGGSLLLWQARRSEAEAQQKTSFVANVSHEFKTPLTTIRLYAELLEQGRVRDAAQGADYLRTIGRETQRLARLVNNALDFSRLEQGRKKFARQNVDLREELTRLLDTQSPRLAEAGLTLTRALPTEPLFAETDRDAFEQIVLNLIDNACKYAAGGGELVVALSSRAEGGAELRVADRGPGVPPEHRERIFEKFHRVDETLTAEKTGAGLGLSIARQLARGLGGELRCEAHAGAGAEFVLELP